MNCQAVVTAKTIGATQWEGLSLFRVLRKKDLRSSDRLTQEKCQPTMTSVCTGGKAPPFYLLSRSGNEWLVGDERIGANHANLTCVVDNPLIPPSTGWKFRHDGEFVEDPQLRCSSTPTSSSCSITVSLSGLAKEFQGECEGMYKDTGLRSMGRKVISFSI